MLALPSSQAFQMRAQNILSTGDPQMVGTDKIIIIILRNTRFPIFLEIFQTGLLWLGQVIINIPQKEGLVENKVLICVGAGHMENTSVIFFLDIIELVKMVCLRVHPIIFYLRL